MRNVREPGCKAAGAFASLTSTVGPLLFTAIYAGFYNNVGTWWAWSCRRCPSLAACPPALRRQRALGRHAGATSNRSCGDRGLWRASFPSATVSTIHAPHARGHESITARSSVPATLGLAVRAPRKRRTDAFSERPLGPSLFEDRQPRSSAVDVAHECHASPQPFGERLHGLFLLVSRKRTRTSWSLLRGPTIGSRGKSRRRPLQAVESEPQSQLSKILILCLVGSSQSAASLADASAEAGASWQRPLVLEMPVKLAAELAGRPSLQGPSVCNAPGEKN